jgi:hypothetical protein
MATACARSDMSACLWDMDKEDALVERVRSSLGRERPLIRRHRARARSTNNTQSS